MRLAPPLSTRPLRTLGKAQSAGSFQGAKSASFLMLGNMPPKIRAILVMARERRLPLLIEPNRAEPAVLTRRRVEEGRGVG